MKTTFLRLIIVASLACTTTIANAAQSLGVGTGALLGNDLTDLGNDGNEGAYAPPDLAGFDAEFFSSDEPGFGGGEFAFNVFDNVLGGGNDKWCCGTSFPQIVGAILSEPVVLGHFTLSSANDSPARDPRVWTIDGSNDGTNWTTIFSQDDPDAAVWTERLEVMRFDAGQDFDTPDAYSQFRLNVMATGGTTGAFFQVGELELFAVPEPSTGWLAAMGLFGLFLSRRRK